MFPLTICNQLPQNMLLSYVLSFHFAFVEFVSGVKQSKRAIFPQGNPTRVQVIQFNFLIILKLKP